MSKISTWAFQDGYVRVLDSEFYNPVPQGSKIERLIVLSLIYKGINHSSVHFDMNYSSNC